MIESKVLIPNKEWIIKDDDTKIGSVLKIKKGYTFIHNGKSINFEDLSDIEDQIGVRISDIESLTNVKFEPPAYTIYDYPCSAKPHRPLFNVKKKLPIFTKNLKSKSYYCAGYYHVKFKKGWTRVFCPKLITLERYEFKGPYRSVQSMTEF